MENGVKGFTVVVEIYKNGFQEEEGNDKIYHNDILDCWNLILEQEVI